MILRAVFHITGISKVISCPYYDIQFRIVNLIEVLSFIGFDMLDDFLVTVRSCRMLLHVPFSLHFGLFRERIRHGQYGPADNTH